MYMNFSVGGQVDINYSVIAGYSMDNKTVYIFNDSTMALLYSQSYPESILGSFVQTIFHGGVYSYMAIHVTASCVYFQANNSQYLVMNFNQTVAGGLAGSALSALAIHVDPLLNSPTNSQYYQCGFNVAFANKQIYYVYVNVTINFVISIASGGNFIYCFNSSVFLLQTFPEQVQIMITDSSSIVLVQNNVTKSMYAYNFWNGSIISIPSSISLQTCNWIFSYQNLFYLLQWGALYQISVSSNAISVGNTQIFGLPNNYFVTQGGAIDAWFAVGGPFIYPNKNCTGNSNWNGTACATYNCIDLHCSNCPIAASVCSICLAGFNLTGTYICLAFVPIGTNTTNITNNGTLSGNISNWPSNIAVMPFGAWNQLDGTIWKIILEYLFNLLLLLNKVPGSRRVLRPVFFYYPNLDDIYMYSYHDRLYGPTAQTVLDRLSLLQSNKWELLNMTVLMS